MASGPSVFLSYCWNEREQAEQIYRDLSQVGINVKKDSHQIKYRDNLKAFMQSIRDADFAILLISPSYLKSSNCMYELGHLLKEKEFLKKILPVVIDGTKIYKPEERLAYVKFWQAQYTKLKAELLDVDPTVAMELYADLRAIGDVAGAIDAFLQLIASMLNISYSELKPSNYRVLLDAMGFEDIGFLTDLLVIAMMDSVEERELRLDEYLTKYQPSTYYHTIKATTASKAGKHEQARFNYYQALKLKDDNIEALNNLGYLYDKVFKNAEKAKENYEKAISIFPHFTIARLNLGVLKAHAFKDPEGAKFQYERILSYEPNQPKAHNNLGNYYKKPNKSQENFDRAEFHYKTAIAADQEYAEAYINYGNLLKFYGRLEEGNEKYKRALDLCEDEEFKPIILQLIESVKG